jgi:hypothetical protein
MQLYKPNRNIKGSAISINFSAKTDKDGQKGDKSFYFQMIHQVGWDEKSGNGTFKDGKKVIVKFAPHEVAGIIAAINKNMSLAETMNTKYVYHDGDKFSTNISFEPHFKSEKKGNEWVKTNQQAGFLLRATKTNKQDETDKDSIAIGFTWAETELLKNYLINGLSHISNAWYSENIARGTEKKATKEIISPKQELPVSSDEDDF